MSLLRAEYLTLYASVLFIPSILHFLYRCLAQRELSKDKGCQSSCRKAPVKDPFIGLDFIYDIFFGKRIERYLDYTCSMFQSLGHTYAMKRWTWQTIFTCDSANMKHMLAIGFEDFDLPRLRLNAISTLLGSGIFSLNGEPWAHARAMLKPCFANKDKDAITSMLEGRFQALLSRLPSDGSEIDLQPLFFYLAMDFATQYLTGNSSKMLDGGTTSGRELQFFEDYTTCSEEVVRRMRLGPLQVLRFNFAARRAKRRVFKYIDDFIDESLKAKVDSNNEYVPEYNILRELAAVTSDRKVLRDQVLHILVAARDTTASLLGNLFFVLAKEKDIYDKLRSEVISIAGNETPTHQQLKQMEYLKWCVQECKWYTLQQNSLSDLLPWYLECGCELTSDTALRLHPVIPTNAREATRDTTLPYGGGQDGQAPLFVNRGALIVYNIFAMHRDKAVFGENAEEFVPERWSGLRPGWGYLPFNGGPRICLGRKY
jgi:cytochrome P450